MAARSPSNPIRQRVSRHIALSCYRAVNGHLCPTHIDVSRAFPRARTVYIPAVAHTKLDSLKTQSLIAAMVEFTIFIVALFVPGQHYLLSARSRMTQLGTRLGNDQHTFRTMFLPKP
jgi:hypothetical protein